jgi:hypothetical protein
MKIFNLNSNMSQGQNKTMVEKEKSVKSKAIVAKNRQAHEKEKHHINTLI